MNIEQHIKDNLHQSLNLETCIIENESSMHAGPATDSHFKLTLVSDDFIGKRLISRHQTIFSLLKEQLAGSVHALSMHLYTLEEWKIRQQQAPKFPACLGVGK